MAVEVCESTIAVVLKPSRVQRPAPRGPKGPVGTQSEGKRCPSAPVRKSLGSGIRPALASVSTCVRLAVSATVKVPMVAISLWLKAPEASMAPNRAR